MALLRAVVQTPPCYVGFFSFKANHDPPGLMVMRSNAAPGAAVFAGMEGKRPVLVEIQALVAQSTLGTPRRAVVGWDSSRLAMILAVLESHCGVRLGGHDVYLNVAGGFRISEPAADLAVAAANLGSNCPNRPAAWRPH